MSLGVHVFPISCGNDRSCVGNDGELMFGGMIWGQAPLCSLLGAGGVVS
jgi:hypothetical protein